MKRIIAFITVVVVSLGIMGWTSPDLLKNVRLGLDLKGGFEILYEASPLEGGGAVTRESLLKTAQSLEDRANKLGTSEPEVTTEGTNRIRLKLAGVTDEATVRKTMKEPASLTFRSKDGTEKNPNDYNKIEMVGTDFVENGAKLEYTQMNEPVVSIKVKDKEKFAEVTKRLLGKPLAIYMNDQLISAPVVQAVLTDGSAQISVGGDLNEAKELRDQINLGALPLKLTEKYSQSVGATLGMQSLQQTIEAGLIASAFILLFMIGMYRVPGLIASLTLIIHTWLLILVFVWADFTLTLPGIAALILGVGMAVDANIITNERIHEEIRTGKSIMSAVKAGDKHSLRTVLDSNITTIIVAAVMYWFGTGAVKGFALVLIVEIVLSIATNVYLSRFLLNLLLKAGKLSKPKYFGVKERDIRAL
ncbi:MAG: protein translocase subunit SecD [Paenibacillus macerans]|uniref:Protein translocase subunit SecD n=1 Tax=Paenibacillus macerans TaxID=44252 RepID=A0A090ZLG4_PAEMA|nr:protein translocase subunit SecD [Paenibacillus macerans]KFN11263.1 export membrane protein SecD [Paenibacillus macerans]MBS5911963.1 protein translocase subunit SecD [Paenibacillus macerans]MCY7558877.1 protein translocase subunit SecD [Paenibacillus macerans]MDU7472895.1 protein translocase subunit SecD [Paenibacillus macerans]MEC0137954.1 protein translocase subunit SecD [Paenibacillus macerans]